MTTHSTSASVSLTDRYVGAALRSVPLHKRSDIEPELRTLIADAVDARVAAGEEPPAAEVAALTALGDPGRLAAGYADHPLHLIGPTLYLDYVRLLRVLVATVLPITVAVVTVVQLVRGGSVGQVIGTAVSATITTGVHLAFWTTLLFVVIERTGAVKGPLTGPWTPAMLPEPRDHPTKFGEVLGGALGFAIFATIILLAPLLSPKQDAAGDPINILNPWLWDSGAVYLYLGLLALAVLLMSASYYTEKLRVAAAFANIPAAGVLIWLAARGQVVNPAFTEAVGWTPEVVRWIHLGLVIAGSLTILVTLLVQAFRLLRP